MIISVNWLKQFTEITLPIDELATLIGNRLVEVEEIIDIGAQYQGVLIADVKKVTAHPNADKLRIVLIDDGGKTELVDRDENGWVQVVCGAANVREGIKVAWLAPGVTLPATFNDPQPVVLEARELRGVLSNGMLASAKELNVGEDHSGILEIDKDVPAGSDFAPVYELDDYLLDIENKSLTHRPDCFGLIGFAREVAAIQGNAFVSPAWLNALEPKLYPLTDDVQPLDIVARIDDVELSKRYQLVAFDTVNAAQQSPFAIQSWLARVGIRPINAVVDITNYLMYLTGQPTHAFDLDAVIAEHPEHTLEIVVREARDGETLALLDGRTITLAKGDILICSGETPIGLAGAMGGATTEVTDKTTRVLLESATFDLYRLRTTQMRHGIRSEAITRFTKGQSAEQTAPILGSAARMLEGIVGARRMSAIVDEYHSKQLLTPIEVPIQSVNRLLGTNITPETAAEILQRVEMQVEVSGQTLLVTPPYWRGDIHIIEDMIEEIGRIYGYDAITPELPKRTFKAVAPSRLDDVRARIRQALSRAGANEILSYSFVPERLLQAANQDPKQAFRITNALSHDLQYYRLSLTPSLLEKIHPNVKAGFSEFSLFELNKVHNKLHADDDEGGVPKEFTTLACVYANQKPAKHSGAAFYQVRKQLDYVAAQLGFTLEYASAAEAADAPYPIVKPYNMHRAAFVTVRETGDFLGIIGEFAASTTKKLKLPAHAAGFEVDVEVMVQAADSLKRYAPLSRYPGTTRDITFSVADEVSYAAVEASVQAVLAETALETRIEPVVIYKNEKDAAARKHVTLRLHLTNHERTLTADEANGIVNRVVEAAERQLQAQVV